jgi:hypothetical protein
MRKHGEMGFNIFGRCARLALEAGAPSQRKGVRLIYDFLFHFFTLRSLVLLPGFFSRPKELQGESPL